jgi:hypothetical protein
MGRKSKSSAAFVALAAAAPVALGLYVTFGLVPLNLGLPLEDAYRSMASTAGLLLWALVWVAVAGAAALHELVQVDLARRTWPSQSAINARWVAAVVAAAGWGMLAGLPSWVAMDLGLAHVLPFEKQAHAWAEYAWTFPTGLLLVMVSIGVSIALGILTRRRMASDDAHS